MPVLSWIGKDKVVNHDKELPFRVLKPVKNLSVGENSENLLIEGDNLEALKALMPFYYNKVKCIYIDPPYNTGNEKWVYNDKVNSPQIKAWLNKVVGAEGEDLCRHDKWLSMMYPRFKLLRDLLTEDGVIFVSIDDNEVHNMRSMMDEIFGESNFLTTIIWQRAYAPVNLNKYFSQNHDYIVAYTKKLDAFTLNKLKRTEKQLKDYKNIDNDPRGVWKLGNPSVGPAVEKNIYEIISPSGRKLLPPNGRSWLYSKKRFEELKKNNRIWFGKDGASMWGPKMFLSEVSQGITPMTLWEYKDVGHTQDAKREIKLVFPTESNPFPTPKPLQLIKRIIQVGADKDSIILDSFAGSGTTGHAVLEQNKEDGGNRKFILVEIEREISKNITAKRIKKVIEGYEGAKFPEGTGGGFDYLDLNGVLYDYSGYVNPDAKYEDMAAYIYFTETQTYLDLAKIKNPYIGVLGSTHYFLFFKEQGNNILDEETLKKTDGVKGTKVIYADKCLIDDETLTKKGIIFKQIPYELKKY